jgi:hypothetical protein
MRKSILLFIFLLVSIFTFGQTENNNTINRISINDYYVQAGNCGTPFLYGSLPDFQLLAPNSVLLNKYSSTFPTSNNYYFQDGYNSMFSVLLGFKFSDQQKTHYKKNIQLRLGITYYSNSVLSYGLNSRETIPFDTLTSTQTGATLFIDSVISRSLEMSYETEQLRIDASLIFRSNPEARWSIYSGIGVTAGMSFNAKTYIFYSKTEQIESQEPYHYSNNYNYNNGISESEMITNKNNFAFSAFIPLGIDFRIGKKRDFWKRIHLFYEIRPTLNILFIPELGTMTNTFAQQGLGIRIAL